MNEAATVFIVDGAGGAGFLPFVMKRSLARSPIEVRHFTWGKGFGHIVADLTNREHMQEKAAELSAALADCRSRKSNQRLYLVAKSAGTALALMALANLEPDTVDRAILLSPAVSPGFPLGNALRAVREELVSFWSPYDWFYLWLGTSLFGTADGVFGKSAGLTGFFEPTDNSDYRKLRQVRWNPTMLKLLHPGTHFGNSMPPFIDAVICPLLQSGAD